MNSVSRISNRHIWTRNLLRTTREVPPWCMFMVFIPKKIQNWQVLLLDLAWGNLVEDVKSSWKLRMATKWTNPPLWINHGLISLILVNSLSWWQPFALYYLWMQILHLLLDLVVELEEDRLVQHPEVLWLTVSTREEDLPPSLWVDLALDTVLLDMAEASLGIIQHCHLV